MPAGSVVVDGEGVVLGVIVVVPWVSAGAGIAGDEGGVVVPVVCAYARPIEPTTAAAATNEVSVLDAFMSKLLQCCLSRRTVFETG